MASLFPNPPSAKAPLSGELRDAAVLLVGPFVEMGLREARGLVVDYGGRVAGSLGEADTVVVGDGVDGARIHALRGEAVGLDVEFLTEPVFLQRLIDADRGAALRGMHLLTGVASVVGAPPAVVRRWWLRGHLRPARRLGRLPLFDWLEVRVAKRLAGLLAEGRTPSQIDAMVDDLERQLPGVDRPLAAPEVDVHGGRLLVRSEGRLAEPSGQVVIEFDGDDKNAAPPAVALPARAEEQSAESLREEAWRMADEGEHQAAVEACRVVLLSGAAGPDDHFLLANLLYEQGDPHAARERYYAAIECDPGFIEARVSLGCLLAELGDYPVAVAVLRGATEVAPDLPDGWFHLATTLDRIGDEEGAAAPWRRFLELSPSGPWADHARDRIAERR